jgi:hypothetical protein
MNSIEHIKGKPMKKEKTINLAARTMAEVRWKGTSDSKWLDRA